MELAQKMLLQPEFDKRIRVERVKNKGYRDPSHEHLRVSGLFINTFLYLIQAVIYKNV